MKAIQVLRSENGGFLVFAIASIIAILMITGFAIDIGQLYIGKQRAQNICDSSALAGAQGLALHRNDLGTAETSAATMAESCASANNSLDSKWQVYKSDGSTLGISVSFPSGTVHNDAGTSISVAEGDVIRTEGTVKINYAFAGLLGDTNSTVRAVSQAIVKAAGEVPSTLFIPLTVSDQTVFGDEDTEPISFGEEQVLKTSSWQDNFLGAGNFGPVILPGMGNGASDYKYALAGNSSTPIDISVVSEMELPTKTGNMVGPTNQGLRDRLRKETNPDYTNDKTSWANWLASYNAETGMFDNTWRIVLIPIIQDPNGTINGKGTVEVIGYAGFFIESFSGDGTITGRFLQGVKAGDSINWIFPTGDTPTTTQLIYEVKIIS